MKDLKVLKSVMKRFVYPEWVCVAMMNLMNESMMNLVTKVDYSLVRALKYFFCLFVCLKSVSCLRCPSNDRVKKKNALLIFFPKGDHWDDPPVGRSVL